MIKRWLNFHSTGLLTIGALIIIFHFPLILKLTTHVYGRSFDDVVEVLWQLRWMEEVVFQNAGSPWFTPDVFYPNGWYIAASAQPPWYMLALSPLTHLLGDITTYNLLLLGTLYLAGTGTYFFTRYITNNQWASIIAGLAFLSAPNIRIRFGGQMSIMLAAAFLPYAYYSIYRALQMNAYTKRWALLASITLAATILGQWYFLFIATLPLTAFLFYSNEKTVSTQKRLIILVAIGSLTLLFIAPFGLLTKQAHNAMFSGSVNTPLVHSAFTGLSIDRIIYPYVYHPLLRPWFAERLSNWRGFIDGQSAVGYTTLVLAAIGLFSDRKKTIRLISWSTFIALILAMGPMLYWNGKAVSIPSAPAIADFSAYLLEGVAFPPERIGIPLPGALLYWALPFYGSIRMWVRYMVVVAWGLAMLTGAGVAVITQWSNRPKTIYTLIICLLLFEGWLNPLTEFTDLTINERPQLETWLEQQDNIAIMEYPRLPGRALSKVAMYSQFSHGQSVVNGYMSFTPAYQLDAQPRLGTIWPNQTTAGLLNEWGVDYILVSGTESESFRNTQLAKLTSTTGFCLIREFDEGFMHYSKTFVFAIIPDGSTC